MSWTDTDTAILVIHGVGQQSPYETIDGFGRTLRKALEGDGGTVTTKHELHRKPSGWVESYLSFGRPKEAAHIDLYEFYWAHLVQRKISSRGVLEWIIQTSDGASDFYAENTELAETYRDLEVGAFDKQGRFKTAGYLKFGGVFAKILRFGLISWRGAHLPTIGPLSGIALWVAGALMRWVGGKADKFFVDYVGDVAIYTTTDWKATHFAVRDQILREAEANIWDLLDRYERVILVGHSLGSVIAYDVLSRVALRMSVDPGKERLAGRIGGLVTFGSPLDKIAFFFRLHTPKSQIIRRQIQAHRFGFRARYFEADKVLQELSKEERITAGASAPEWLQRMPWLNFWNPDDPISGHLDYYELGPGMNVEMDAPEARNRLLGGTHPIVAHGAYFGAVPMYERIIKEMIAGAPSSV